MEHKAIQDRERRSGVPSAEQGPARVSNDSDNRGSEKSGAGTSEDRAADLSWWEPGMMPADEPDAGTGVGEPKPATGYVYRGVRYGPAEPEAQPPKEAETVNPFIPAAIPENRPASPAARTAEPAEPAAGSVAEPMVGTNWWETRPSPEEAAGPDPRTEAPNPATGYVYRGMRYGPADPEPKAQPPKEAETVNPFIPAAIPENRPAPPAARTAEPAEPAAGSVAEPVAGTNWWETGPRPDDEPETDPRTVAGQETEAAAPREPGPEPTSVFPESTVPHPEPMFAWPEPISAPLEPISAPPEPVPAPPEEPARDPEMAGPAEPATISEDPPALPSAEGTVEPTPASDGEPHRDASAALPADVSAPMDEPFEGAPVDVIRSTVADICPGDLLLVETGEIPLPEWTHAAMTAAHDDLDRRAADGASIDGGEFLQLAIVENLMGHHEEAEAHLKEALPRSDRLAPVLNALAVVSLAREKIAPAIVYGKEALQETGGDDFVRAAVSSNLGDFYRLQGNEAQAAEAYEAAIASLGPQGDSRWLSRLHLRAGRLHRRMAQADKARQHLSDSVRLFKAAHNDSGHVQALAELGSALTESGSHDLAIRHLEEGIRICLRTGDRPGAALVQQEIGAAYKAQDQLTRALAYFESALSLHRELGDRTGEADTLSHMGKIHDSRGDVDEARQLHQAALEISRGLSRES